MRANFQPIPYALPSVTYVAGGNTSSSLALVPKNFGDLINHIYAIQFKVQLTPTISGGGTLTPDEMQNVVTNLQITDGVRPRFSGGGFGLLRWREIYEHGRLLTPDSDALATGEAGEFNRVWFPAPQSMANEPSDGLIPVSGLQNGEIKYGFGASTACDANCSAITCTITPIVWLAGLPNEVRLDPVYEFLTFTAAAKDVLLAGDALYAFLAAADSSAFGALTAGDIGSVTIGADRGNIVPGIDAQCLTSAYHMTMGSGHLSPVMGDPRAATDDSPKVVSGTALASSAAQLQPLLWTPPGTRKTKLVARASNALRVAWSGANGSGTLIIAGRFLSQSPTQLGTRLGTILSGLPSKSAVGQPKVLTLSKQPYRGTQEMAAFMAYKQKVA